MECTKVNCPMQAGTLTDNCGENCPWRTTAKTTDLISRAAAIEAVYYKPSHKMAIEVLKEVPAVDAAPVVHARWRDIVPFLNSEECSRCGYNILSDELETPYCPWCGAKMDGERRDDDGSAD